jgi:hypothetical protein
MGRRVTGSTMERRRRERGDGIGKDKSGWLTGVDIYMVGKYMDNVKAHSIRSSRRGTDARGGAFMIFLRLFFFYFLTLANPKNNFWFQSTPKNRSPVTASC